MGDLMLNGRQATDFELAAIKHGRDCELKRDREQLKGLLPDAPRVVPLPAADVLPALP